MNGSETFRWLRAVHAHHATRAEPALTALDVAVAVSVTRWFDGEGVFFRSGPDIGRDNGCTETAGRNSVARLKAAGFLRIAEVPKVTRPGMTGRPATTYRAVIPESFRNTDCGNSVGVSPTEVAESGAVPAIPVAETGQARDGLSATAVAPLSATYVAAISMEEPTERKKGGNPLTPDLQSDVGATVEDRVFASIFGRWPKRGGEAEARRAFHEAVRAGASVEAIARGAAAYVIDRHRDPRGPAATIQFTTPLARWLSESAWETWGGLPDAERAASAAAADELSASIARRKRAEEARRAMPF